MSAYSAAEPADAFRLGLNYWPAATAMHWWSRYDQAAVEAELAAIAAAGFRYLRFFLLWEAFQTAPDSVVPSALRDLERFADSAARFGLRLQPTLFTGHMSGANWLPEFATRPANGQPGRFPTLVGGRILPLQAANFYADERLIRAQELLARETAGALAHHPALWSWDLGNEPSNLAAPDDREQGRRWLDRLVGALRAGGSEHPVTIGLHMEDLEQDRRLGPAEAAEACDYLSMHGYPLYAGWARNALDTLLLPFLGLVTQWLGAGKPLLFQEFGLPVRPPGWPARGQSGAALLFDEQQAQVFFEQALALLRRERFLGAFAWCANDYAEALWHDPPLAANEHERFFGLFRADGSAKLPLAAWRQPARGAPLLPAARGLDWIEADPRHYYAAPLVTLRQLFARFSRL
jgi:endo-1,4-beta-mannosidase